MKNKTHMFDAFIDLDGVEVVADWRYPLIVPYIMQSPSFIAIRNKHNGLTVDKSDLPQDSLLVSNIAKRFDLLSLERCDTLKTNRAWWDRAGKFLYGTRTSIPRVEPALIRAGKTLTIEHEKKSYPVITLQVPLTLTETDALKQIKLIFRIHKSISNIPFNYQNPDMDIVEFKLSQSRLRQDTLINGVRALAMYKAGQPLWKIGNDLLLSPVNEIDEHDANLDQDIAADKKRVLSIMAHRLVKTAALVAENAARGRFPSDEHFPEAIVSTFTRKAGRPVGSKRPKRLNGRGVSI
jgi:hypothetical protein